MLELDDSEGICFSVYDMCFFLDFYIKQKYVGFVLVFGGFLDI